MARTKQARRRPKGKSAARRKAARTSRKSRTKSRRTARKPAQSRRKRPQPRRAPARRSARARTKPKARPKAKAARPKARAARPKASAGRPKPRLVLAKTSHAPHPPLDRARRVLADEERLELNVADVDTKWQDAFALGDEAQGSHSPTPDIPDPDRVDEIGAAMGIEYQDDQELMGGEEVVERDRHRWEK